MCGILGSINSPFENDILSLIHHRGPDDSGLKKINLSNHLITLGHTRLSIVDLSITGHQPMYSSSGNFEIIFNGEIYNHSELREKLIDVSFKGTSDTESIINYIEKYGIESVKDFNGIFSFAILDRIQTKIYISRDPFGVKPLYIYKTENSCVFSSEMKPILALNPGLKVDKEIIAESLRLRYTPSPDTLVSGISKILPGEILEIDFSNKKLLYKNIQYTTSIPKTINISFDEALSQYEYYFENAVKRQLLSDVEIGVLLSGGVDSAMVAYYAQKHSEKPLKAFTIGFNDEDNADEIDDAKETAEFLGLDHYVKKISFSDFLKLTEDAVKIVEEPLATTSIIPMYYLSELASKHVKVVLTGQGADEPLGGYKRYQLELLFNKIPSFIKPILTRIFKNSKNSVLRRGSNSLKFTSFNERVLSTYTLFEKSTIFSLIGVNEKLAFKRIDTMISRMNFDSEKSSIDKNLSLDLRLNLADDLLLYTDKITMHHSIEARVPILDTELINFIESLPSNLKVKFRKTKIIHKALAMKILPSNIVNRKKKGFMSPTEKWFTQYNDEIFNLLTNDSSNFSTYFDVNEVGKIIKEHLTGINKEKEIFILLNYYYWMKNFL